MVEHSDRRRGGLAAFRNVCLSDRQSCRGPGRSVVGSSHAESHRPPSLSLCALEARAREKFRNGAMRGRETRPAKAVNVPVCHVLWRPFAFWAWAHLLMNLKYCGGSLLVLQKQ